jgi:PPOX class probable F420-dependent enzyme
MNGCQSNKQRLKRSFLMPATLSENAKQLLEKPYLAHFVTIDPDGAPQITPVWVDHEGDQILINTAEGRKKPKNLANNKHVAVQVVDPADPWNVLSVTGHVVAMEHEGADAHIDKMAKKYIGQDTYPFRQPGEQRVLIRIQPDRIRMQPKG